MAVVTVLGACHIFNIPLYQTVHADVYYPDTGWIDMGPTSNQSESNPWRNR